MFSCQILQGLTLKCEITLKAPKPHHTGEILDIEECDTLGEHLRRKRLKRNESQAFVAKELEVEGGLDTLLNWELNYHEPHPKYISRIITYLGYTPLFDMVGTAPQHQLKQYLFIQGKSINELGRDTGMCTKTIRKVLKGGKPSMGIRDKIQNLHGVICAENMYALNTREY